MYKRIHRECASIKTQTKLPRNPIIAKRARKVTRTCFLGARRKSCSARSPFTHGTRPWGSSDDAPRTPAFHRRCSARVFHNQTQATNGGRTLYFEILQLFCRAPAIPRPAIPSGDSKCGSDFRSRCCADRQLNWLPPWLAFNI
jgi:hypothetical protein